MVSVIFTYLTLTKLWNAVTSNDTHSVLYTSSSCYLTLFHLEVRGLAQGTAKEGLPKLAVGCVSFDVVRGVMTTTSLE